MAVIAEEMLVDRRYQQQTLTDGIDRVSCNQQDNVSRCVSMANDWTPPMSPIDLPYSASPEAQSSSREPAPQVQPTIQSFQSNSLSWKTQRTLVGENFHRLEKTLDIGVL